MSGLQERETSARAKAPHVTAARSLMTDLSASLRNPEFWALSSWLDIVVKYRQSRLGVFWILAPPLVYIWGLGIYMAPIGQGIGGFVAHVALGIVVFRLINAVITESANAFVGAQSFIMDGHTRLTDFVLRVIAKALFYFVAAVPVVASALLFFPGFHPTGLLTALVSLLFIVVNLFWIGVVFALIGARLPDLGQFINNIFMFAFLLTPIVWYPSAMPEGSVRGTLMRMNPIYHMVETVRAPLMGGVVEPVSLYYLAALSACGWIAAILAYRRYARFVALWI